ncbi:Mis12-Mtw1 protein family-domain-containing protein [Aspergillus ambiguus]|uniref:Mis12-Mtw1 family protein n=1 Tax=Aspergillus ambiguus TaxID=176160 RepID=UPI003CCE09E8
MATSQTQARPASSAASGGTGRKGTRSSTRLSLNSQEKADENGRSKRKGVFDEDVEGFQFSFKSKKQKPLVEPVPEDPAPKPSPRRGRPPKKRAEEKLEGASESKTAQSAAPEREPESEMHATRRRDQPELIPTEKKRKKGRPRTSNVDDRRNGYASPEPQPATATIALPMADTPVIQRNKEMRGAAKGSKGSRRSSLGMRGRRASSLIDSGASNGEEGFPGCVRAGLLTGSTALPHKEVNTADFYKHIAADLPEPRRMRQLLIWCATRAMGQKPSGSRSEDESARLAARVIQEELLKDFSNNSELSNWFAREDVSPRAVVVKKPNPKNVQNTDKIKELEEQIQRLQRERQALNALLRPPSIASVKTETQESTTLNDQESSKSNTKQLSKQLPPAAGSIDPSLLDPTQRKLFELIRPEDTKPSTSEQPQATPSAEASTSTPFTPSIVSTRLSRIISTLSPTLDSFAAGMHDIELYRAMSDTVSSRVLRICAERLDERDARNAMRRLAIEGDGSRKDLSLRQRPREDLGLVLGALSRLERR